MTAATSAWVCVHETTAAVQDYASNSGQPIAPAASTFGAPAAPAFGAAAPAASGLFGAAPAAGGGMFGAPATPAFGVAPSQFVAPTPGGMFGAPPAAVAPATGGSGFGSTGGGMFGQQAPAPTFGVAPAAFGSIGAGFGGIGAPQVSAPSSPPRFLARPQPLRTDRLSCAVLSSVCDPWRNAVTAGGEYWLVRRIIGPVIVRGSTEQRLQLQHGRSLRSSKRSVRYAPLIGRSHRCSR